jgi:DNA invertase Pin-like site-specific DNA recombinase
MSVAIYCRVSTEDQDADKQEYINREYCNRMGWPVFKVYKDVISGTKTSRPAFNELLTDMREFKFDTVIVTKLDRMGRSLQHLLSILDEFNNKKIKFVASTQNIDTTSSTGKLQLQIMGAFAEFERNMISERTKEGLMRAKNVGKRGKDKKPRKWRSDKGVKRGGRKKAQNTP